MGLEKCQLTYQLYWQTMKVLFIINRIKDSICKTVTSLMGLILPVQSLIHFQDQIPNCGSFKDINLSNTLLSSNKSTESIVYYQA